ncbi:MAG: hybrid sensor histidine kinase/response regulator [Cyanobacteria bacterium SBLK]|nr:hybrid sensor histidine kinase/response regulator [Cyanobacteria bacterium SBLK]
MSDRIEVLVVDDMPANLEVLTETLSSVGYTISAVTSGERTLKQLKTYIPDLILLDIQMPGIDGFETCRQIKANADTADIPIIFITALSDSDSITRGFSLGAVDYITKPFREVEVLARVKTHLKLRGLTKNLERQIEQRTADLTEALQQLQSSQIQLVQHEKMATLGNLVAGVAHEINNPLGFINGNLALLQENFADISTVFEMYRQELLTPSSKLVEILEEIELDFLIEDFPQIIASMRSGCDRIANISTSLRTFSRTDADWKTEFNLHEGLDSTLLILKYRLKANAERPVIEIVKNYGNIPPVKCYPGQLNQVFMNLLANAIDALDESNQGKTFEEIEKAPNRIIVKTELSEDRKSIIAKITDNGMGMPDKVKARIFEQGFTTKEVGKGTGLGMAIARQIIAEKHGGAISCQSELGKGTEFTIFLPIR